MALEIKDSSDTFNFNEEKLTMVCCHIASSDETLAELEEFR
jgi:hypothetical protein